MWTSECWLKFVRFYLDRAIKLCKVNPAGEQEGFGPSTSCRQLPLWSHLAEVFYYYFTIKLLIAQLLQHDYNRLAIDEQRIAQLDRRNQNASSDNSGENNKWQTATTAKRDERDDELEVATARMRLLGNAYYELGYVIEPTFILILILIYLGYCQPRLYVAKRGPVRLGVLSLLLDAERERALVVRRDVARGTQIFVASLDNFVGACRERILHAHRWLARETRRQPTTRAGPGGLQCRAQLLAIELTRKQTVELVHGLARTGQLTPPNRRPEWLAHVARQYGRLVALFELVGFAIIALVLVLLPRTNLVGNFKIHNEPLAVLFQVEMLCYGLLGHRWLSFYLMALIMNAYDQIEFVRQLERLVTSLIEDTRRAAEANRPAGDTNRVSGRLIRALILYKQYVGQLRAARPFVGFVAANFVLIMLCPPVMERIYAAHLAREVRWVFLVRALIIIISCDMLLLPHCWLHARSLELHKRMSALLAQIDAHRDGERVVDEHAVHLLRRELNSTELPAQRFATRALCLRITYADLVGIHFWCGFLLAPSFMRDTAHLEAHPGRPLRIF